MKDLKALGMRPKVLQSLRPTILHLVEQEWVKRIELVSFLNKQRVKKETLELFFYASLRFNSVQVIKKGIADFVGALHDDFPLVCERVGSSCNSAVSRLVDEPRLFLQSLQTVASKLGQNLVKVWAATVCVHSQDRKYSNMPVHDWYCVCVCVCVHSLLNTISASVPLT